MTILLIAISFVFIIGVGFAIGRASKKSFSNGKPKDELEDMREEAREAVKERTNERKEKILNLIKEGVSECDIEEGKKGITRNDIEKLLDVTDGTADKYLNELESEGKIKQIGATGRGVYYILSTDK